MKTPKEYVGEIEAAINAHGAMPWRERTELLIEKSGEYALELMRAEVEKRRGVERTAMAAAIAGLNIKVDIPNTEVRVYRKSGCTCLYAGAESCPVHQVTP